MIESYPYLAAAIQPPEPGDGCDLRESQHRGWELARQAVERGARLVLFPEQFNVYSLNGVDLDLAIAQSESICKHASLFASDHGVWLGLPLIQQRDYHRYNTLLLFDERGRVVHRYDKTHLVQADRSVFKVEPGCDLQTCETDLGRVAAMLCYDVYFPEVVQVYAMQRAQLVLFASLQRSDNPERIELLTRARAVDGAMHVIRSCFAKGRGGTQGGSCIVAPDGEVLASAGDKPGFAMAVIDPGRRLSRPLSHGQATGDVREALMQSRQPHLYHSLFDPSPPLKSMS